jgi:hypothetical protein
MLKAIYVVSAHGFLVCQGMFTAVVTVNNLADLRHFERLVSRDGERANCSPGRVRDSLRSVFGGGGSACCGACRSGRSTGSTSTCSCTSSGMCHRDCVLTNLQGRFEQRMTT